MLYLAILARESFLRVRIDYSLSPVSFMVMDLLCFLKAFPKVCMEFALFAETGLLFTGGFTVDLLSFPKYEGEFRRC